MLLMKRASDNTKEIILTTIGHYRSVYLDVYSKFNQIDRSFRWYSGHAPAEQ